MRQSRHGGQVALSQERVFGPTHYPRPDYDYGPYLKTMEMPAGSFAAFNSRIWHQRGGNSTSRDRIGMSIPYTFGYRTGGAAEAK